LDELVVHVEAVHLQDSLQTLAKMPESERLAVIDKIIEQVKKEEEEAKALAEKEAYLAEQEAKGTGIDRPGTETGASHYRRHPEVPVSISITRRQYRREKQLSNVNGDGVRWKMTGVDVRKKCPLLMRIWQTKLRMLPKERWANWLPIRSRPDWNLLLPMTRKHVSIIFSSFR